MITYMLTILLQTAPVPVFAYLRNFDSLEECRKAIKWSKEPVTIKAKMGCIAIAPLKETV